MTTGYPRESWWPRFPGNFGGACVILISRQERIGFGPKPLDLSLILPSLRNLTPLPPTGPVSS